MRQRHNDVINIWSLLFESLGELLCRALGGVHRADVIAVLAEDKIGLLARCRVRDLKFVLLENGLTQILVEEGDLVTVFSLGVLNMPVLVF